jgi:hypothetical protein
MKTYLAKPKIITIKFLKAVLVMACIMLTSQSVHAAQVVYEDVGFIFGTEATSSQFSISRAGTYEATLSDFQYPSSFEVLSFQLTQGSPSELFEVGRLENTGSFTFDVGVGSYYANIFGVAGGAHEIGLYGLQITQLATSAVPLPPAVLLFLSSALVMFLFGFNGSPEERDESAENRMVTA